MKDTTHVVVRADRNFDFEIVPDRWWWACIHPQCPGDGLSYVNATYPTQQAAMYAALDHCDYYSPEIAEATA